MNEQEVKVLRNLIDKLILPKYKYISLNNIDAFDYRSNIGYNVNFITLYDLDSLLQMEIDTEVKKLFKMASLDTPEDGRFRRNHVSCWFKTPRQKEFKFTSKIGYIH